MPERPGRPPQDEGWRDIHLDDIARGVGSLINFVSDVVESFGSTVGQARTPAARPISPRPAGAPADADAADQRDLLLDLFDEGEEIVLVAEWPDDAGPLEVSVQDDVLTLAFADEAPPIELLLPAVVDPASLRRADRNGIVEIRLRRAAAPEQPARGEP